jgi:hypothetical protein
MSSCVSCLVCVQLPSHFLARREKTVLLAQIIPNPLLWNTKFMREITGSDEVGHETRLPSEARFYALVHLRGLQAGVRMAPDPRSTSVAVTLRVILYVLTSLGSKVRTGGKGSMLIHPV